MVPAEESVHELAGAILDGSPIDWQLADSGAGDTDRTLIEQLRVLAALADVHRRPLEEGTALGSGVPFVFSSQSDEALSDRCIAPGTPGSTGKWP